MLLNEEQEFPDVNEALTEPNGLLAIGGDLTVARLVEAYHRGIFPWYTEGQPYLWWSPNPRAVLFPEDLKINRSLKKLLNKKNYTVTIDHDFAEVISGCAKPRKLQASTWITEEMKAAYCQLYLAGYAHSVEVWQEKELIAGLYGVDCGRVFTGESMFSKVSNAAKIAFVYLVTHLRKYNYRLIDCQINNHFLKQFGTKEIPRADFLKILSCGLKEPRSEAWLST